jgi:hypothetical protein
MSRYSTLHQLHFSSGTPQLTACHPLRPANTRLSNSPPDCATGHWFTGQGADDSTNGSRDMFIVSVAYNLNQLKCLTELYINTVLASMSWGVIQNASTSHRYNRVHMWSEWGQRPDCRFPSRSRCEILVRCHAERCNSLPNFLNFERWDPKVPPHPPKKVG